MTISFLELLHVPTGLGTIQGIYILQLLPRIKYNIDRHTFRRQNIHHSQYSKFIQLYSLILTWGGGRRGGTGFRTRDSNPSQGEWRLFTQVESDDNDRKIRPVSFSSLYNWKNNII